MTFPRNKTEKLEDISLVLLGVFSDLQKGYNIKELAITLEEARMTLEDIGVDTSDIE